MPRDEKELKELATKRANEKYKENFDKLEEIKKEKNENIAKGKKCQAYLSGDILRNLYESEFRHIYLLDKSEYRSFGAMMDEDINDIKKYQKDVAPYYQQKALDIAVKTYLGLKYRSEHKPLIEKLKHPFQSIKLFFMRNSLKNMLKKDYGLSDKALDVCERCTKMDLDSKRYIGFVDLKGNIFQVKATDREIEAEKKAIIESDKLTENLDKDIEKENVAFQKEKEIAKQQVIEKEETLAV